MNIRKLISPIIFLTIAIIACSFGGGGGGEEKITVSTPEDAVRRILIEASQGDERGLYSYTVKGVNTSGDWPGDLLYHCRGILLEKDKFLPENFSVEFLEDTKARVTVSSGFLTGDVAFLTEKVGENWLVSYGPPFNALGKYCD